MSKNKNFSVTGCQQQQIIVKRQNTQLAVNKKQDLIRNNFYRVIKSRTGQPRSSTNKIKISDFGFLQKLDYHAEVNHLLHLFFIALLVTLQQVFL